jgi:hypothetical protein
MNPTVAPRRASYLRDELHKLGLSTALQRYAFTAAASVGHLSLNYRRITAKISEYPVDLRYQHICCSFTTTSIWRRDRHHLCKLALPSDWAKSPRDSSLTGSRSVPKRSKPLGKGVCAGFWRWIYGWNRGVLGPVSRRCAIRSGMSRSCYHAYTDMLLPSQRSSGRYTRPCTPGCCLASDQYRLSRTFLFTPRHLLR